MVMHQSNGGVPLNSVEPPMGAAITVFFPEAAVDALPRKKMIVQKMQSLLMEANALRSVFRS